MQDLTDPHVIKRAFSSSSRTHYTDTGVVAGLNKLVFFFFIPLGHKKENLAIMFVMVEVRNMRFWTLPSLLFLIG